MHVSHIFYYNIYLTFIFEGVESQVNQETEENKNI